MGCSLVAPREQPCHGEGAREHLSSAQAEREGPEGGAAAEIWCFFHFQAGGG